MNLLSLSRVTTPSNISVRSKDPKPIMESLRYQSASWVNQCFRSLIQSVLWRCHRDILPYHPELIVRVLLGNPFLVGFSEKYSPISTCWATARRADQSRPASYAPEIRCGTTGACDVPPHGWLISPPSLALRTLLASRRTVPPFCSTTGTYSSLQCALGRIMGRSSRSTTHHSRKSGC